MTAHLDRTALVHPAGARSVRGLRPVLRLAAELDELAAATGTPLTASGAWLRTCLDGGATPWAVTAPRQVRDTAVWQGSTTARQH